MKKRRQKMATIKKMICDWCNKECEGDRFTVYRENADGLIIGKSDYCEECWNKMHTYLYEKETENDPIRKLTTS
jgi:uncharacterized repeat protein (TIGR04076 family)